METDWPEKEELQAFLKDYEKIVTKHNLIICGCGCCGSPFVLIPDDKYETAEENLKHLGKDT